MQKQKNAVSKKTEKLLLKVLAYLEEDKRRLDMGKLGDIFPEDQRTVFGVSFNQQLPPCKTVACLAGTCLLVTKEGRKYLRDNNCIRMIAKEDESAVEFPTGTPAIAGKLLGLNYHMYDKLFYFSNWGRDNGWPLEFCLRYEKANSPSRRFAVTKARVLHFIKTGE